MTEKDAAKLTKYFSEGVRASVWCYAGDGNWAVTISRGNSVQFLKLDPLKRRAHLLKTRILEGSDDLRLIADRCEYPEDEIEFADASAAWLCIAAIGEAVTYVQSRTKDPAWHEVPSDLFDVPKPVEASLTSNTE